MSATTTRTRKPAAPKAPKAPKATGPQAKAPKADANPVDAAEPADQPAAPANCACGCGQPTVTAKARFLSGHDARYAGVLGRSLSAARLADPTGEQAKPILAQVEALTPALQIKVKGIEQTATRKAVEKQAKAQAKAVAKAAYEQAMADLTA